MANQFAAFGWDVTVVNGDPDCWAVETGLDLSMLEHVDPRVRVVEVPVRRRDLDHDIRTFSRQRARDPSAGSRNTTAGRSSSSPSGNSVPGASSSRR